MDMHRSDVVVSAVETRAQSRKTSHNPLRVQDVGNITFDVLLTLDQQECDKSLQTLFAGKGIGKVNLVKEEGLWFMIKVNKYRDEIKQLLLPKDCREYVLTISHEGLMGGHLGIRKTEDRALSSFYWPGVT